MRKIHTAEEIAKIRSLRPKLSLRQLAERFGGSSKTMSDICAGIESKRHYNDGMCASRGAVSSTLGRAVTR
jgi:hypothetical protein